MLVLKVTSRPSCCFQPAVSLACWVTSLLRATLRGLRLLVFGATYLLREVQGRFPVGLFWDLIPLVKVVMAWGGRV